MPYRQTRRSAEQLARMRAARDAARMSMPAPEYPPEIPTLRRRIEIIDYDFGERRHVIEMYRCGRIDSYRVVADGVEWKARCGWSAVLVGIRRALPRLASMRQIGRAHV